MATLEVKGVEGVGKSLDKITNNLKNTQIKIDEVLDAGKEIAKERFDGSGFKGISVFKSNAKKNKSELIASGKEVLFAEYGAGIHHMRSNPHPFGLQLGYTAGSYGKGYGAFESWGFYSPNNSTNISKYSGQDIRKVIVRNGKVVIITAGNKPAKAMYFAGEKMKEKIKGSFGDLTR